MYALSLSSKRHTAEERQYQSTAVDMYAICAHMYLCKHHLVVFLLCE